MALPTQRSALSRAATTTMAVPCWSSWKTGMSRSSRRRASTSKHRGAEMSSRLIPPKPGAMAQTVRTISSTSWVSRQIGHASTSAKRLNSAAFPSMTGRAAWGPRLPSPSTAEPSVTTATVLPLVVSFATSAGRSAMARHTRATPGVYAMDRSSRVRSGILDSTEIFPPRCSRKVRSLTRWTAAPGTLRRAATNSSAWAESPAEQETSTVRRSGRDSAMSMAVTRPPAAPTAVATRPITEVDGSQCRRAVIA